MEVAPPRARIRRASTFAAVVVAALALLAGGGAVAEEARPLPPAGAPAPPHQNVTPQPAAPPHQNVTPQPAAPPHQNATPQPAAPPHQNATPQPAAPPHQPAPQAAQEKVLRVATSGDYAPFSFEVSGSGGDAAALDGLDVEIAKRFANDRGYRMEIVRFRWPDLSKELAAGSFDVAMSGVTVRPERSIAGRLSVPVAATQAVALTWKGSGVDNLVQLDKPGRRITVNAGGHLEKVTNQFFRRAEIVSIADNAAVRMALLDRTADAVVTDNFEEKVWTVSAPDARRLGTLSDDHKAYLLPAANAELAGELDRWLLAREADGTLADLRRRYLRNAGGSEITHGDETLGTAEPVAALAAAVRERLELMPFVYEAKKAEGRAIEDKAQEEAVLDGAVRSVAIEAAAAGRKTPDAEAVRALFDVLIATGKDAQKRLADADARVQRGTTFQGSGTAQARANGATPRDDVGAGANGASPREDVVAPADAASAQEAAVAAANGASPRGDVVAPADAASAQEAAVAAADGASPREAAVAAADGAGPQAVVIEPSGEPAPRNTGPELATEIRPAIARIGEKIARILVALKEPVSAREARSRLESSLSGQGVRSERLDEMAEAVARISSGAK